MGMSERCLHNEVCKYGENRSNGMYCTEEKCRHFKNITKYAEVVRCKDCKYKFSANGHNKNGCPLDAAGLMNDDDFCSYGERKDNERKTV